MAETSSKLEGEQAGPQSGGGSTSTQVVEQFLDLLRRGEVDQATDLLAVDVVYENVGLPTVYGRARVRQLFQAAYRAPGAGFEVYVHSISTDGSSVMTERTDVLKFGRLRTQFWVCGRFDVRDGEIVLWRDYFDHLTVLAATVRGLLGVFFPSLRAAPPPA
jgi:limonene-1,2-epoxide hydrolase